MSEVKFSSPLAQQIWDTMVRVSGLPDNEVPYDGFHVECGMSPDQFDRGIQWLRHFDYVDLFPLYGALRLKQRNPIIGNLDSSRAAVSETRMHDWRHWD